MDDLQQRVGEWGRKTFPHATSDSILKHLREEVDELEAALKSESREDIAEECSDVLLMLLHLAHRQGFSLRMSADWKLAVCQQREWLPPDESGVSRHKPTSEEPAASED